MSPTQLIFVPMLFVLPPAIVPLVVAAALLRRPAARGGRTAASTRSACSGSLERRLVLGRAGAGVPARRRRRSRRRGDWHIYVLALGAQFACDLGSSTAREWLAHGVARSCSSASCARSGSSTRCSRPSACSRRSRAPASHFAFLLVLPLAVLLAIFARERRGRIGTAIELSATYRGTALLLGDVISSDDELTGTRRPGRRRAGARDRRRAGARRGAAPARRVRGDAPGHRQDGDAARDPQQAGPAERGGVGADAHPPGRGPADARSRRRDAARRRARRALGARALRGRRLPRRAGRPADPDRRARPRGRGRLLRDDDAPPVPAAADAPRRRSPSCARAAARSSTPRSSTRPAPSSHAGCRSCPTSWPTRPERGLWDRSVSLSKRPATPRNMALTGELGACHGAGTSPEKTEELLA